MVAVPRRCIVGHRAEVINPDGEQVAWRDPAQAPQRGAGGGWLVTAAAALCCVLLVAGFALFARDAGRVRGLPPPSDGIVVLTGGALRVTAGLALLHEGVADRILISGVADGVTLRPLLEANAGDGPDAGDIGPAEAADDRITLGHEAQTTAGNAREIADWAERLHLRSLVVVTADYHMRRALAEIHAVLPAVALRPYPVHPSAGLRLMAVEYVKYLAVRIGLAVT